MTELESIEINEPLSQAKNRRREYPAVSISHGKLYFNRYAADLIDWSHTRVYCSTNYIVFKQAFDRGEGAYTIAHRNNGTWIVTPRLLRENKVKLGSYKLYKTKDGFCIKRNEVLERR